MMQALAILLYLANVVCWIYVLMKIFQDQSIGLGILGLVIWPFAFAYGWFKAREFGIQNVMLAWTVLLLAATAVGLAAHGGA